MNPSKRLPIATLLLLALNVGVAYLALIRPGLQTEYGFRSQSPNVFTAFTSMFIHSNIVHLLGNMLFLAAVGATVEQLSGSLRFLLVYFASGLGGVAAHWLFTSHSAEPVPLVGASGCIAGCAAYYSVRYMHLRLPVTDRLKVNVAAITSLWLALQALGAFVSLGEQKPVTAFWAHLGGFAIGVLLSIAFRAPDIGKVRADNRLLREMGDRSPGALLAEAEMQLKERPDDPHILQEMALVYEGLGEREEERNVLYRLLEVTPEAEQGPLIEKLCSLDRASRIPIHRRLMLADRLKSDEPAACRELLRTVLSDPKAESSWPDTMVALAALEMEHDPEAANALLQRLAAEYPLHPAAELARAKGLL